MIELKHQKVETISVTDAEAKAVVIQYIKSVILGNDCYITTDGRVEHWTSWPHGSGTTTDMGKATPLQLAAWEFLGLL